MRSMIWTVIFVGLLLVWDHFHPLPNTFCYGYWACLAWSVVDDVMKQLDKAVAQ